MKAGKIGSVASGHKNFLSAVCYLPLAGLQVIVSIALYFIGGSYLKLHALQAIAYWVVNFVILLLLVGVLAVLGILNSIAGLLVPAYLIVAYFILPLVFAYRAFTFEKYGIPGLGNMLEKRPGGMGKL